MGVQIRECGCPANVYHVCGKVETAIDAELNRKRAEFPTLDVRSNADGELIRHIEPWEPIVLSANETNVTVTPCRCVTVEKGKLGATD